MRRWFHTFADPEGYAPEAWGWGHEWLEVEEASPGRYGAARGWTMREAHWFPDVGRSVVMQAEDDTDPFLGGPRGDRSVELDGFTAEHGWREITEAEFEAAWTEHATRHRPPTASERADE